MFKAKEVELSPKRKRKHEAENDDVWEPEDEVKHKKHYIDKDVEAHGTIMNPNEMRCIHSRALVLKDSVEDLEAHRNESE